MFDDKNNEQLKKVLYISPFRRGAKGILFRLSTRRDIKPRAVVHNHADVKELIILKNRIYETYYFTFIDTPVFESI